jgi:hypothetical protein
MSGWLLASQGICSVESAVFSDLLIKFLQNAGNYLNRLHSVITQYTTVLKLYMYCYQTHCNNLHYHYMDRYTGLSHHVLQDLGLKGEFWLPLTIVRMVLSLDKRR